MKALSLTQPWATLMAIGAKEIETRSWGTRHRGWLAIHAAKHFNWNEMKLLLTLDSFRTVLDKYGYTDPDCFPLGAVLAVGNLHDVARIGRRTDGVTYVERMEIPPGPQELVFGNYEPGRWGWRFSNMQQLQEPILAKGSLSLWEWEPPADLIIGQGGRPVTYREEGALG